MPDEQSIIESGQRAVALLSLYLDSEMEERELDTTEVAVALNANEKGEVPDQVDLITALIGINIALLYAMDSENPRKVLQLVAQAYSEWETE